VEEVVMSLEDLSRELSYQHIAELHADAERYRQVRLSKRSRQRRTRGRLGRLLRPSGVAARANGIVGGIISPPWSRRDPIGPSRPARA
jgi:anti-sigma factor RsiW